MVRVKGQPGSAPSASDTTPESFNEPVPADLDEPSGAFDTAGDENEGQDQDEPFLAGNGVDVEGRLRMLASSEQDGAPGTAVRHGDSGAE